MLRIYTVYDEELHCFRFLLEIQAFLLVSLAPDDITLNADWSEYFVVLVVLVLVFLEGSSINHKFQQVSTAKTILKQIIEVSTKKP